MVSCAMTRRRTLLIISAAALLVGNIALFGWGAYDSTRPNAAITYVGIDSLVLSVSPSQKTTVLTKGRWNPDPRTDESVRLPAMTQSGQSLKVVVIRLGPALNYERLIQSIRSLRAHNICHVGIVEGANIDSVPAPNVPFAVPAPNSFIEVPTFVLCGEAVGDASGFDGKLPPDALIRL